MKVTREYEVEIADWTDTRQRIAMFLAEQGFTVEQVNEHTTGLIETFTLYADIGDYEIELHFFKTHGLLEDGVNQMYVWSKEDEEPEGNWLWGPVSGIVQELGSTITE